MLATGGHAVVAVPTAPHSIGVYAVEARVTAHDFGTEVTLDQQVLLNQLLYTTTRIECHRPDGQTSTGTGFIFNYNVGATAYPFVVTNKHVVEGATKGSFTFTLAEDGLPKVGAGYLMKFTEFDQLWFGHEDPDIDVAVAPLATFITKSAESGHRIYYRSVSRDLIPSEAVAATLSVLEPIVFIGYPNGLWDDKHFLPIVRSGVTATPPSIDFRGDRKFLVDASVFPGSSGSPVFLYNNGLYAEGTSGQALGSRILFLGVISSVFFAESLSEIVMVSDLPKTPVSISKQMINLGVVFNARTIEQAVEQFAAARGASLVDL